MRITKPWGLFLSAIWLIIVGLFPLVASLAFPGLDAILAIIAIIAGALLVLGK